MEKYNRYNTISVVKDKFGKRRYKTSIMPKIEKTSNDIYIYARKSDRLDVLSFDYYGDVVYWPFIAQANNIGKGTLYVEIDTQLRIPADIEKLVEEYEKLNAEGL